MYACGPHFLVWASLKSRIIPVCLHSRLQRHTILVRTMKGLKTATTSLSQRGQNTQPNKQALLPRAVGRDLINTSKPSQIWSTISIWDLRDHSAISACVSPSWDLLPGSFHHIPLSRITFPSLSPMGSPATVCRCFTFPKAPLVQLAPTIFSVISSEFLLKPQIPNEPFQKFLSSPEIRRANIFHLGYYDLQSLQFSQ